METETGKKQKRVLAGHYLGLSIDFFNDEKVKTLIDEIDKTAALLFIQLLILAKRSPVGGWLMLSKGKPFTKAQIAKILDYELDYLKKVVGWLIDCEILKENETGALCIVNWDKWQDDSYKNKRQAQNREAAAKHYKKIKAEKAEVKRLAKENKENAKLEKMADKEQTETTNSEPETTKAKTQKSKTPKVFSDEVITLANQFADGILSHTPKYKHLNNGNRDKTVNNYAEHIDLMLRLDKREPEGIAKVIDFVVNDTTPRGDFIGWAANVMSGDKLRLKFERLQKDAAFYGKKATETEKPIFNAELMMLMT